MEKITCKNCKKELEKKYFYTRKDKHDRDKIIKRCKWCYGVKNPEKVRVYVPSDEKPEKIEIIKFITEMNNKKANFNFVDSLRLIDIFTRQYGVIYTSLPVEDELMYMWEKMKELK